MPLAFKPMKALRIGALTVVIYLFAAYLSFVC